MNNKENNILEEENTTKEDVKEEENSNEKKKRIRKNAPFASIGASECVKVFGSLGLGKELEE